MSRFQEQKKRFAELSFLKDWPHLLQEEISDAAIARGAANAFLSLLNRPESRWQAAYGLGLCLPLMASENMESARVFMRRLMWSLNEESGNLGWGIPEAMGCILAASPALADEYSRIFISYGYETGKDDNFLDHGPLRRGVYWGIGQLAGKNCKCAVPALPHLINALGDSDPVICAYAAWALLRLRQCGQESGENTPATAWVEAAETLRREKNRRALTGQGETMIEYLDGENIREEPLAALLERALNMVEA